jgi:glycosyltransferase involved in cell wall biosynthesis
MTNTHSDALSARRRISLICTTYNEAININLWLVSLNGQTVPPDQIVIVDGGSTDGTVDLIKKFSVKNGTQIDVYVDPSCNKKFSSGPIARGRNVAISRATNECIISTDAGCVMHADFIKHMSEAFDAGNDYICGAYDLHEPNEYQERLRSSFVPNFKTVKFPENFLPSSRSVGFTKTLWQVAGRYPEDTFTAEDTKFAMNLVSHARSMALIPNAVVFWSSPANRPELLKKCYAYGYGDGRQLLNFPQYLLRIIVFIIPPFWVVYNTIQRRSLEAWFIHLAQICGFIAGASSKLVDMVRS